MTNQIRVVMGGRLALRDCVFQGQGVHCPTVADTQGGGMLTLRNVAIFDSATIAVDITRGGVGYIHDVLWGANNALQGTAVRGGGRLFVKTGIVPTLASTGQELEIENAATCATVVAQLPAAAAALINWAQWNAAPFARDAMSYLSGASVSNTV